MTDKPDSKPGDPSHPVDPHLGDGTASDWADEESSVDVEGDEGQSPLPHLWGDVWVAASFLTRLPIPRTLVPPAYHDGARAMPALSTAARAFPLVGLLVGIPGAVVLAVASSLGVHPLGAALAGLGVCALISGALHEDGLADVADGFGGGTTTDEKKTIMADSRIGTFGVLALVLSVGLRAGLLMSFLSPSDAAFALLGAMVMGRAMLPGVMYGFDPAREDGLGHGAGRPTAENAALAAGLGILFGFLFFGFWGALFAGAGAGVAAYGVGVLARRQIGGISGDVLGAAEQAAESAALFLVVAVYA